MGGGGGGGGGGDSMTSRVEIMIKLQPYGVAQRVVVIFLKEKETPPRKKEKDQKRRSNQVFGFLPLPGRSSFIPPLHPRLLPAFSRIGHGSDPTTLACSVSFMRGSESFLRP